MLLFDSFFDKVYNYKQYKITNNLKLITNKENNIYILYDITKNECYNNILLDMEEDIIILSTVRSNNNGKIGFLENKKRLNVSLTRCKANLIIIGNIKTLIKNNAIWSKLIAYYFKINAVYYGNNFNNLSLLKSFGFN